jgi:hypothetical protein
MGIMKANGQFGSHSQLGESDLAPTTACIFCKNFDMAFLEEPPFECFSLIACPQPASYAGLLFVEFKGNGHFTSTITRNAGNVKQIWRRFACTKTHFFARQIHYLSVTFNWVEFP